MTGKTALITGASSGLGAEFADQLAGRGYNLVLVSRRQDRLEQLVENIRSKCPVDARVLPADLSNLTEIERLVAEVSTLADLDLLVNCAGFGTVGRFYKVDPSVELAMLHVHVIAPVMLCRAALPGMLLRNQGSIINVSSLAGLIPIRNVVYQSTKSFLVSFSYALRNELLGSHVHVQVLCPGFVYTEFHDTHQYTHFSRSSVPAFLWMTPKQVVSDSLKSLSSQSWLCIPGGLYKFVGLLARNSLTAGLIRLAAQFVLRRRPTFINS